MTCSWRTRSPEPAEDHTFRPDFRRIESREIGLLDDEFERLEELMSCLILLNRDDVDAHAFDVGLYLFARDAEVDTSDVAVDGQRSAAPRHDATTRLLAYYNVPVFIVICLDSIFRRLFYLFSVSIDTISGWKSDFQCAF